jgi:benzoate/toluate 1,2-dioxygenase beta subunit
MAQASSLSSAEIDEIKAFVETEAELLDEGRFDEWLALFADGAMYWMPSQPNQTDPLGVPSIFYEDKEILTVRIRRIQHQANLAQTPMARTVHVLGPVRIESQDSDTFEARSSMLVVEYRSSDGQRVFGAKCRHTLRRDNGQLRIVMKRVDMIDSDAPHSFITIPF